MAEDVGWKALRSLVGADEEAGGRDNDLAISGEDEGEEVFERWGEDAGSG